MMETAVRRFACTRCGKCCNRPPEVGLSEAAALCDMFVFRLMFRLYWLPDALSDYLQLGTSPAHRGAIFYQRKRLLGAYAARKYPTKLWRDGKAVRYTKYLIISAVALDTNPGACAALEGQRCSIYERRPLACRTVPFHYSRVEALADHDLNAFVETPGFGCDTGDSAGVVLEAGRIVDPEIRAARADALRLVERDRSWNAAIVRRMNRVSSTGGPLPSLGEVEAHAPFGATTTSMPVAWQIAADSGLIDAEECERLIADQLAAIERELSGTQCSHDARETLTRMRAEYRRRPSAAISP